MEQKAEDRRVDIMELFLDDTRIGACITQKYWYGKRLDNSLFGYQAERGGYIANDQDIDISRDLLVAFWIELGSPILVLFLLEGGGTKNLWKFWKDTKTQIQVLMKAGNVAIFDYYDVFEGAYCFVKDIKVKNEALNVILDASIGDNISEDETIKNILGK